jgi:hypothetical protein
MPELQFDPTRALRVDLEQGLLTLQGGGSRVLCPTDALVKLLDAADTETLRAFGVELGTDLGRRIGDRFGSTINMATMELFLEHLGGEIALMGLGCLSIERWGRALVFAVTGLGTGKSLTTLMAALLEGALQRSLSRDVAIVPIGRTDDVLRLVGVGRRVASDVQGWLDQGVSFAEVLVRLHSESGKGHNS